jgi:hypothetical protein
METRGSRRLAVKYLVENVGADLRVAGEPQLTFRHVKTPAAEPIYRSFGRGDAHRAIPGIHLHSVLHLEAAELARAEASSWAQMSPLMAATLGPLAVLLGIPSLTQRWRGQLLVSPVLYSGLPNYVALPDPILNRVLAGISLFCEVGGNALWILRFSNFHARITTWVSYGFWIAKIVLGMANYIQFGIAHPESDDIVYLEGFWVDPRVRQHLMDRLTDGFQQMNQKYQNVLMQKLGADARHLIAAERARRRSIPPACHQVNTTLLENLPETGIGDSLAEVSHNRGDELELLNQYREHYATMLAELLVAKERVLALAKMIENQVEGDLRQRIGREIWS